MTLWVSQPVPDFLYPLKGTRMRYNSNCYSTYDQFHRSNHPRKAWLISLVQTGRFDQSHIRCHSPSDDFILISELDNAYNCPEDFPARPAYGSRNIGQNGRFHEATLIQPPKASQTAATANRYPLYRRPHASGEQFSVERLRGYRNGKVFPSLTSIRLLSMKSRWLSSTYFYI